MNWAQWAFQSTRIFDFYTKSFVIIHICVLINSIAYTTARIPRLIPLSRLILPLLVFFDNDFLLLSIRIEFRIVAVFHIFRLFSLRR